MPEVVHEVSAQTHPRDLLLVVVNGEEPLVHRILLGCPWPDDGAQGASVLGLDPSHRRSAPEILEEHVFRDPGGGLRSTGRGTRGSHEGRGEGGEATATCQHQISARRTASSSNVAGESGGSARVDAQTTRLRRRERSTAPKRTSADSSRLPNRRLQPPHFPRTRSNALEAEGTPRGCPRQLSQPLLHRSGATRVRSRSTVSFTRPPGEGRDAIGHRQR